jgi:hypothetical protein
MNPNDARVFRLKYITEQYITGMPQGISIFEKSWKFLL